MKDLTACLHKIGGVQSLDSGKKKLGSDSGSNVRDTGSSGPVNDPGTPIIPNVADMETPDPEQETFSRKRKDAPEVVVNEGGISQEPPHKKVAVDLSSELQTPQSMKT